MREYRERDPLGADIPDNPLGGVVVGLGMAVLGGGLMVAALLEVSAGWSSGYLSVIGLGGVYPGTLRPPPPASLPALRADLRARGLPV